MSSNNPTWHTIIIVCMEMLCQEYLHVSFRIIELSIEYLASRNNNTTTLFVKNEEMDYQSSKFQFMLNCSLLLLCQMYKFRQL
jgi:hypothetical protein